MRIIFLLLTFYFGSVIFCEAQTNNDLNDCGLLEKIMNDTSVKKILYSRRHFLGFRNESGYFQNCKSLNIDGKEYKISGSIEANSLDYVPVDIYIPDRNFNFFVLEWVPMEQAAVFDVKKKNGKYIISLNRIDRSN